MPEFCPKCGFDADKGHDDFCTISIDAQATARTAEEGAWQAHLAQQRNEALRQRLDEKFTLREDQQTWSCNECGAVVDRRPVHQDFHDDLTRELSRLSSASDPRHWGGV